MIKYKGGAQVCTEGAYNLWEEEHNGVIFGVGAHAYFVPEKFTLNDPALNRGEILDDDTGEFIDHIAPEMTCGDVIVLGINLTSWCRNKFSRR